MYNCFICLLIISFILSFLRSRALSCMYKQLQKFECHNKGVLEATLPYQPSFFYYYKGQKQYDKR